VPSLENLFNTPQLFKLPWLFGVRQRFPLDAFFAEPGHRTYFRRETFFGRGDIQERTPLAPSKFYFLPQGSIRRRLAERAASDPADGLSGHLYETWTIRPG